MKDLEYLICQPENFVDTEAMIETYKILNGIYDNTVTPNIPILLVSYQR